MVDKMVVLYIRLSKADDDKEEKGESNSISNQRLLLNSYLDKHPDLCHYPRFEAIDDGYSGTNPNRPMLQKAISLAEEGKVVAFCCKDTSRFFRNHHHAGRYIDMLFPLWNVRYLAIGDGYDSEDYMGMTAGIGQAMKNIIYAQYPIMLSSATITAKVHKMKQGKYVGSQPPYGYKINPSVRNSFVIDQEAATVVKRIFQSAMSGSRFSDIARELNSEAIPTPSQYYKKNNPNSKKYEKLTMYAIWDYRTIYRIVNNYAYTGAMVSHRRKTFEVGNRHTKLNNPIVVEDTHEAIVTKTEFDAIQGKIKDCKPASYEGKNYALRGLLHCGICKKSLQRTEHKEISTNYYCSTSRHYKESGCSKDTKWSENELEEIVFQAIINKLTPLLEQKTKEQNTVFSPSQASLHSGNVFSDEEQKKELMTQKMQDYDMFTKGEISKECFLERKKAINQELLAMEQRIEESQNQSILDFTAEPKATVELEDMGIVENKLPEKLTNHLARSFIKAIYLYENNKVEIEFIH